MIAAYVLAAFVFQPSAKGQTADSSWTLQKCIEYSLQQNIQVRKTSLTTDINKVYAEQSKASVFPSLNASVSQNFGWNKSLNSAGQYSSYSGSNGTNYGVNSSVTLYNGGQIRNSIKQDDLTYKASQFDTETIKESISMSVLNAFLQVLYAEEQVKNTQRQIESTMEQLSLAEERIKVGVISKSEYLQVKAQLATEKLTLANAESQFAINRIALMQLMELPASSNFSIDHPNFENAVSLNRNVISDSIYSQALAIKPQIKSAELNKQNAQLGVEIAKAGYLPSLILSTGLSTGYSSSMSGLAYDYQVKNKISPSVGLSLSIPIFQNKQVRSRVAIAKIQTYNAELSENDTKNQLRKVIEQASVDVASAEKRFDASVEEYNATKESYLVSTEKFNQGLLNSVDYLIQKTNMIAAESNLLQSKYSLIFSYKTLDFYTGIPLTL